MSVPSCTAGCFGYPFCRGRNRGAVGYRNAFSRFYVFTFEDGSGGRGCRQSFYGDGCGGYPRDGGLFRGCPAWGVGFENTVLAILFIVLGRDVLRETIGRYLAGVVLDLVGLRIAGTTGGPQGAIMEIM